MPAAYPGAVKVFAARSNGQTIDASHVGDLQDEVSAIETGLLSGTAPLAAARITGTSLQIAGPSTLATLQVTGNSTLGSTITIGTNTYIFSTAVPGSTGQVLTAQNISGSTITVGWGAGSLINIKAYAVIAMNSPAVIAYGANISGISSNGAGDVTLTVNAGLTSSQYGVFPLQVDAVAYNVTVTAQSSVSLRVVCHNSAGNPADGRFGLMVVQ